MLTRARVRHCAWTVRCVHACMHTNKGACVYFACSFCHVSVWQCLSNLFCVFIISLWSITALICLVVFMDEAGLPEESHESLKV